MDAIIFCVTLLSDVVQVIFCVFMLELPAQIMRGVVVASTANFTVVLMSVPVVGASIVALVVTGMSATGSPSGLRH